VRITLNLDVKETAAFVLARNFGLLSSMSDASVARAFMVRGMELAVSRGLTVGQAPLFLDEVADARSEAAAEPFVSPPPPRVRSTPKRAPKKTVKRGSKS
jgi:hypothetical protein